VITLPPGIVLQTLIEDLRTISWDAADILLNYSSLITDSKYKTELIKNQNNYDPVTKADLQVNEIIIKKINEKYKNVNWGILSEENAKLDSFTKIENKDWLWVLDPLDGTRDFIQGSGNYAMHLALNYKNKPFIGVVLIPEKNELWISDGSKVWSETREGEINNVEIKKKSCLKEMTVVMSKNHTNHILHDLIKKIGFKKVISMGSVGCKIASILSGISDIYISLTLPGKSAPKDWDFAAPEALIKAAGGEITKLNNEELIYNNNKFEQRGLIVATNSSESHKEICDEIAKIIKKFDILPAG